MNLGGYTGEPDHAWEETRRTGETGPHDTIIRQGREIQRTSGQDRIEAADAALTLYHGSTRYSFRHTPLGQLLPDFEPTGYNVIRACCDTLMSGLVRNKVRPMFVTENGSTELKEKAKGMQRAVESEFFRAGIWGSLGAQVCRHGCMFDAGAIKITPDYANHRPDIALVRAHDVLVSPVAAQNGNPREMWHVQALPREKLLAEFADDSAACDAIRNANPAPATYDRQYSHSDQIADMIEVWEYWHLPSTYVDRSDPSAWGKNGDGERDNRINPDHDGRHSICIENYTLTDDPWVFDYFPIAMFRPYRTAVGYWSTGLPERLAPAQVELNQLQDRISKIIHMHAVPKLVVWDQAKINQTKITNGLADIITSRVQPSQAVYYLTPQAVPGQLFERVAQLIQWAKDETGLSDLSMSAQKPMGIDHAPGMQTILDSESIRQTIPFREWEDFHVAASRILVDVFRMLAEYDEDFSLTFSDSKQLKHIKWTTVDIEDERWHLRVWPTNLLPQTPGARLSKAMDMYQSGFWDKNQTALALDFPDIESISGDTTAAQQNCERLLEDVIRGEDVGPEPYMNLSMLLTMTVSRINRMQADREDPESIDRVRMLWEQTDEMLKRMSAAPPVPPAPPTQPGAAPPTGPAPVPAMV